MTATQRWMAGIVATAAASSQVVAQSAHAGTVSTYQAVVAGMKCTQSELGQFDCDYRVGRDLHFAVVGIGEDDTAITFYSARFEGDYYATVGVLHGCVIIKPGKANDVLIGAPGSMAFVSPASGRVFRDWPSCARDNGH